MHAREAAATRAVVLVLGALVLGQTSCILSPVRMASSVEGVVVDAATGERVEGALVVVRYDGRYDDVLPDREVLGHLEATSDAQGRFEVGPLVRPGIAVLPYFQTEARVASVLREGYRCARPRVVRFGGAVTIQLQPSLDEADRRDSCRPVPAEPGEALAYMSAWRDLHSDAPAPSQSESDRQLARLLEARSVFGFGENCAGPAVDLALAPGGERAAIVTSAGEQAEIDVISFAQGAFGPPQRVASETRQPPPRVAWGGPDDLVLWGAALPQRRGASVSIFGSDAIERVWRNPGAVLPAAPDPGAVPLAALEPEQRPLDPADLADEGDSMWLGRSFSLDRSMDPDTGLSADGLNVVREDGQQYRVALPGESCGPRGRFGRPHYRIAADGRTALDLRFVEGACHAVGIDLETGDWSVLDGSRAAAVCAESRTIPAAHLGIALRSWARELEAAVSAAGADPGTAYVLQIGKDRSASVETRDFDGRPVVVSAPDFPLSTPLRRIDVSLVSEVGPPRRSAPVPTMKRSIEPL